ncbi:hemerythrin domain-containing protein [Blastococcus sp. SYSU D00669]
MATTTELLIDEHAVLVEQVTARTDDVLHALAQRRRPTGELHRLLRYLRHDLLDQTVQEERLLFPSMGGCGAEHVRPLLADHVALRRSVERIADLTADASGAADTDQLEDVLRELSRLLSAHVVREERALAPVTLDGVGARRAPPWSRRWFWVLESPVVDLDALPAPAVADAVTRRSAELRMGESVELRCSRELPALRVVLARLRSSAVRSTALSDGPHRWRTRLTRLE